MLPPVQTPIRGLQIADTCFYYPEDRGISESVRLGKEMADAANAASDLGSWRVRPCRRLYATRFEATGLEKRRRVWKVLCQHFFDALIGPGKTVLDLACGYGEFINAVERRAKDRRRSQPRFGEIPRRRTSSITASAATELGTIAEAEVDVVFTSNFLEHLPDKSECDRVLAGVRHVLKPGGRFIVMGPNIRYAYREYWDYYDHSLALSDRSLAEGLRQAGFDIVRIIPRFLPYTMNSAMPASDILVRAYLALPPAWRVLGKQFLIVARRPSSDAGA